MHGAGPRGVVGGDHSFPSPRAPDRRSVFSASRRSANASSRPLGRYNTTVCRATDHGVENRGREHCHADHAEEHYRAQSLSHLGARAGGHDQRDHAEDEREASHEDRPQAQSASMAASAACLLSRSAWDGRGSILNTGLPRGQPEKAPPSLQRRLPPIESGATECDSSRLARLSPGWFQPLWTKCHGRNTEGL